LKKIKVGGSIILEECDIEEKKMKEATRDAQRTREGEETKQEEREGRNTMVTMK